MFAKKTMIGFKKVEGRTLAAYVKGNKLILEGSCDNKSHLQEFIRDLKLDTYGYDKIPKIKAILEGSS